MIIRLINALMKRVFYAVLILLFAVVAVRTYDSQRGPSLEAWHTYIPREMRRAELEKSDWAGYVLAEQQIFADIKTEVTQKLAQGARVLANRFVEGSPVYPGGFQKDWNRSYVLEPDQEPVGAVVLLHGLTDSPFSMRHVANHYRERGFVALVIRLPAHGTVPAALTEIAWEDWSAATDLAMREARRRVGPSKPLHIVGYSNGGALAMMHVLEALDNPARPQADRVILFAPMIGITEFARFSGLAGLPAVFPVFAKAAWLSILPEFNPFKYNSFPVNGARESFKLTQALQSRVRAHSRNGQLQGMPPVLTFQSVLDHTVHTSAIVSALYDHLPQNGSELVLFDINRAAKLGPLLRPTSETMLARILPNAPRAYAVTTVTNVAPDNLDTVARGVAAASTEESVKPLGLVYPADMYSLSHVAIPFAPSDGLYGFAPDPAENFGIRLGTLASRGEIGALIMTLDTLMRAHSNPFFPFVKDKMSAFLPVAATAPVPPPAQPHANVPAPVLEPGWRALGQEPSWSLSRQSDMMLLETNFGADQLRFAIPEPVTVEPGTVRYTIAGNGKTLTWTVKTAMCADTMSGMPHPQQVTVQLDELRLTGCGGSPARLLQGNDWIVTHIAGQPVLPSPQISMSFSGDGSVSGSGSCNRFNAGYQLTGEGLSFSREMSSMMACEQPLMDQEQSFHAALERVSRFSITPDGGLVLHAGGNQVITARKTP